MHPMIPIQMSVISRSLNPHSEVSSTRQVIDMFSDLFLSEGEQFANAFFTTEKKVGKYTASKSAETNV